jgi:predicted AAA+ superfamily ATPase
MQIIVGPRQVGKTTLAHQVLESVDIPSHYGSADEPTLQSLTWIEQQWDIARVTTKGRGVLVLDEIQKIPNWAEVVKHQWDIDTKKKLPLHVVLLGSSALLIHKGLTESLAGRFELIPVMHWSFTEMRSAFGFDLQQYIYFGGYPGAATLISDENRWSRYIIDSLVETTISRDVLLMTRVDKPALLRRLFMLGCEYSGQILSYQKMLGQLQDVGNTTTLAHYLDLLSGAGMLTGIPKYSGKRVLQRASSPKLQVLNTALMSAQSGLSFESARQDRDFWGRLTESAIGAHLINTSTGTGIEVFYWRERNREVDFVIRHGKKVMAIEVKSGRGRDSLPGMEEFSRIFKPQIKLLVGGDGISVEDFLQRPLDQIMKL